jgi:RNAse (barnase) inhibitor barstar
VVHLDGASIQTDAEFLEAIASALRFPDYFGRNWNALDDCLLDVDEPTIVEWTQANRFATAEPEGYAIALSCFADTTAPVELRLVDRTA